MEDSFEIELTDKKDGLSRVGSFHKNNPIVVSTVDDEQSAPEVKSTVYQASFNFINSIVGAGIIGNVVRMVDLVFRCKSR